MTQKDLGDEIDSPAKSAAVRIAQYESCKVSPKKDTALLMSKALNCNYMNTYYDENFGKAERFMFGLFWMEELTGNSLYIFQLEKYYNNTDERTIYDMYNDYNYDSIFPPVALTFNYRLINDFMFELAYHFNDRQKKEISDNEYFEWKLNWHFSCDNCGRFEPSILWQNPIHSDLLNKPIF